MTEKLLPGLISLDFCSSIQVVGTELGIDPSWAINDSSCWWWYDDYLFGTHQYLKAFKTHLLTAASSSVTLLKHDNESQDNESQDHNQIEHLWDIVKWETGVMDVLLKNVHQQNPRNVSNTCYAE